MSEPDALGVRVDRRDGLLTLTLDRPPVNVVTTAMLHALADALAIADDPDVRVVRLDAEGRAFSAGVAVEDHVDERVAAMTEALGRTFDAFERVPCPTVAVVRGAALGGGFELALATDLCVAARSATFGLPEIRLGVFAPPASVLLPRKIGERAALGLLLTGETIPAERAAGLGIVQAVLPDDDFDAAARAWCERLLALSGVALRHAKRAVTTARGLATGDAHRATLEAYLDGVMRTEDAHEGLAAFLEKRTPVWRHR